MEKRGVVDRNLFRLAAVTLYVVALVSLFFIPAHVLHKIQRPAHWPNLGSMTVVERQEAVANIIAQGDYDSCGAADGYVMNGLDYGVVCRNNVAYQLAIEKFDERYCDRLDNKLASVDECRQDVMMTRLSRDNSPATCEQTRFDPLRQQCRSLYFTKAAVENSSIAPCQNLFEDKRTVCEDGVRLSVLAKQPSNVACSELSVAHQEDCQKFKEIVTDQGGNVQACSQLDTPVLMAGCFTIFESAT